MQFAKSFTCPACGKVHTADIGRVLIEKGAINRIPEVLDSFSGPLGKPLTKKDRLFFVMDDNTRKVAGERVETLVKDAGYHNTSTLVFTSDKGALTADEAAMGKFYNSMDRDVSLIIAVGSGTINDMARFVSFKFGIPYMIVATAPSMDGYASSVSPLIVDHLKTTFEAVCAAVIIADTEILAAAPVHMIAAGYADILGKYNAICDWKMSSVINGEYFCGHIADMVMQSLHKCVENTDKIAARDPEGIHNLAEALILTGVAMAYAGNSRPASSSEHHLAHFWEMMFLFEGKEAVLHGTKVGIASLAMAYIHNKLVEEKPDFDLAVKALEGYDAGKWESTMRRVYQKGAKSVIRTERTAGKNDVKQAALRIRKIQAHWDELVQIQKSYIPNTAALEKLLFTIHGALNPKEVGLSMETVKNSLLYAKEIRPRYSVLQLLWDLHLLESYAKDVCAYYERGQSYHNPFQSEAFAKETLARAKCYVLDMDGTFYLSDRLLPGAKEFLDIVEKKGGRCLFYTNNSSKNKASYLKKLENLGVPVKEDALLISNQVAIDFLKKEHPGASVFLLGTPLLQEEFEKAGITLTEKDPDLVIVGFDTTLRYDNLEKACTFIRKGVPYYGINPDFNCPVEGGFIPDCGSIWALISASTGAKPTFFGKPSKRTLDYLVKYTGLAPEQLVFVGDRLYTDIAIGKEGPVTTVLVLSGEASEKDLYESECKPTLVFDSIKALGEFIK